MNGPAVYATRRGVARGLVEFRNSLRSGQDIAYYVLTSAILVTVLYLNRDNTIEGSGITTAMYMLPGVLALTVFVSAAFGMATQLSTEREDGTLLRLKSIPYGMTGYVAGHVTRVTCETGFGMAIILVPSLFFLSGLADAGAAGVLAALGYILLGLLAVVPIGLIIGSVFRNPRSVGGWGMLVLGGVVWVSGLFFPLVAMAPWVQVIGQTLPTYWLGLGLRSALLPDGAVVAEIGESWRTLATIGVLATWAIVGLALAPVLLRRMARRESGSAVAARREKQLQRV